ncbi:MAG TPA: tetratricopeptide repeat protein [Deltaproteobacteria bacterium]|nr:tetratricopeptide repeat protein [Deltaproteobacteria bacterium]
MIQRFLLLLGLLASLFLGGVVGWADPQNSSRLLSQPFSSGAWEGILDLHRNELHEETLAQLYLLLRAPNLEPTLQRRAWMLAGKSALALNRPQEARVFFERVNDPEVEDFDLWLYYRIKAHLVAGEHPRAIYLLQLLLDYPAHSYYLTRIQQDLLDHFRSDAELRQVFPLLEYTSSRPRMLFQDYRIYQQYVEASRLSGIDVPFEIHLLAWQYSKDEDSAKQMDQIIAKHKGRDVPDKAVLNRVRRLTHLKLNRYLMQHLPKLAKGRKLAVRRKLGEVYLQILLAERYFSKTLQLQQQGVLAKRYGFTKPEQLYWMMQANHGLDRTLAARNAVYELERSNRKSWLLPKAYRHMALHYKEEGDEAKAAFWWRRLIRRFPEHNHVAEAYWELAWHHYNREDYKRSLQSFEQGLKSGQLGLEGTARHLYWLGKTQLKLKRRKSSRASFRKLVKLYPNTYYGVRIRNEYPSLVPKSTKPRVLKTAWHRSPPPPTAREEQLIRRCDFLLSVDEPELAMGKLRSRLRREPTHSLVWEASLLLHRYGQFHDLMRLAGNHYLVDLKRQGVQGQVWELAFPRAYWDLIQEAAQKSGVDPYFALAVMREESLFDPQAISRKQAMGLMQLMPFTAKEEARRQKIWLGTRDAVFDPRINTRLGTGYLGRLAKRFQDELILTAGSYNAGPSNMKRWLERWKGLPVDEFVETIPFLETRNYVKRVYRTFQIYKRIYQS